MYVVTLLMGIWYTPFTVHHLGISLQAVVQLAASFVFYMWFVTGGVSASVGRLVMVDAARGDMEAANRTFNTFIVAAQKVALILLGVIALVVVFVVPHLNYPPGLLLTTQFLFAAILGTVILQLFSMCLDSAIWVSGRIDVRSTIFIIETLVRSGIVFALFSLTEPKLWHIGVASLGAGFSTITLYFTAWKRLTPELKIDRKYFDAKRFREIRGQGGYMLFFQAGSALQFNADLIVLNVLLGREIQGSYGLLLTWCNILRGMLGSMGQLLASSLAAYQASEDHDQLAELSMKAVRMQGMLIAIPIGVLCGLARPALLWWVGPEFTFLAPIAWLILVPLVLEGSFNPLLILVQAPETLPFGAATAVSLGALNVVLGIVLVKFTSMGMYGIAVAVATTSVLRHAVVLPIYVARLMRKPWYLVVQQQAQIIIQLGITGAVGMYAAQFLHTRSLPQLLLAATAAGSVSTVIAMLQLSKDERARLLALVRRK